MDGTVYLKGPVSGAIGKAQLAATPPVDGRPLRDGSREVLFDGMPARICRLRNIVGVHFGNCQYSLGSFGIVAASRVAAPTGWPDLM